MKPNHIQAIIDASGSNTNLANAYWEVLKILADITHHAGAFEENKERILPIVQAYLSNISEQAIPSSTSSNIHNIVCFRGGHNRTELQDEHGKMWALQILNGKLDIIYSPDQ